MTRNSKSYCEYHHCDGNHTSQRNLMKSDSTNSKKYLIMALNNSTNNRLMEEKLEKCQEKMQKYKKQSVFGKTSKRLPQLSEIKEESEDCNNSSEQNIKKIPELILPSTQKVLRQMLQMQIDIKNILRTYS